jgi:hypothetical protein
MPLFGIAVVWLSGWLLYRVVQHHNLELSPATLSLSWVLGTGILYTVYYSFILLAKQSPPPLIMIVLGIVGGIELVRLFPNTQIKGWQLFQRSKILTILLVLMMSIMCIYILVDGYHYDTVRMWLFKAQILHITPDYHQMMDTLIPPQHPDYPMVYTHQLQWQLIWSDSLVSLKLPTWMAYINLILATTALLIQFKIRHSVAWLIFLAGFPQYWSIIPTATADLPISMMLLVAMTWLNRYLDGEKFVGLLMALGFGWLVLTKNEGILLVLSILVGLCGIAIVQPSNRKRLLRAIVWIVCMSGLWWISWYAVVVSQSMGNLVSDFSLSSLTIARIPEAIELLIPILFNPFLTASIWIFVIGCFLTRHFKFPIIWIPLFVYLILISSTYVFSIRPSGLYAHIVQSYFRLLLQVTPLAIVYLGMCFSNYTEETA